MKSINFNLERLDYGKKKFEKEKHENGVVGSVIYGSGGGLIRPLLESWTEVEASHVELLRCWRLALL
ncbi:hypothetical protein RJ641_023720 [Dillenia turbinata]|uniref:Uncharacterized protein n=1 Tax=Dillenia turbinata TaxID=194707 RepID=A0AAN8YT19_9MAGN